MLRTIYEGTEDQMADLAISLHSFLGKWKMRHPEYNYTIEARKHELHLTVIKNGKK